MAESAISRTPSLPSRFPKTPFTNAPRRGSASTTARSVKFDSGNWALRASTLVPQKIGLVRSNRLSDAEEREADREPHGGLRGRDGDDEEGKDLPAVVLR